MECLYYNDSSTFANGQPPPHIVSIPVIFDYEERAATLVQSCYKGHLVRRTEPLRQLRIIREVKSELKELKFLLSDVDFIKRAQQDTKVKLWLTEGLMGLLFKLDAIQGSHPVVREIRRAATREVADCQDEADVALRSVSVDDVEADEEKTVPEVPKIEPLVNDFNSVTFASQTEFTVKNRRGKFRAVASFMWRFKR